MAIRPHWYLGRVLFHFSICPDSTSEVGSDGLTSRKGMVGRFVDVCSDTFHQGMVSAVEAVAQPLQGQFHIQIFFEKNVNHIF